jgi:hypothetical protein
MSVTNLFMKNTTLTIQKQNLGKYCPVIIVKGKKKVYFNYISNIISSSLKILGIPKIL